MSCHVSKQFVARLTKHGWFDNEQEVFVFRDIVDQVGNLLRVSISNMLAFTPSAVTISGLSRSLHCWSTAVTSAGARNESVREYEVFK